MAPPRLIDVAERRARLGVRHALAGPVASVEAATEAVVAVHSTDPVTIHLSGWARTGLDGTAAFERALHDEGSLVRMHGVRRTLWVVPRALEPAFRVAAGRPLARPDRARLVRELTEQDVVPRPEEWLDGLAEEVVAAVAEAGEMSAVEIGRRVPGLATRFTYGAGTKWPAEVTVGSRLLIILGFEGRLVRSRPVGTWVSGQYRYVPGPGASPQDPGPAEARAAVVGAVLERFGPVTETDVRWWTGWTKAQVVAALAACGAVEARVDEGPALVAPGDEGPVPAPAPWVALLPSLDATTMGWKQRDWYLGDLGPLLFDRNGNAGHTVWVDGRVVGAWAQRPDGEVVTDLRVDVGHQARAAVADRAAALEAWFAGTLVTPRYRSPLERALHAGSELP